MELELTDSYCLPDVNVEIKLRTSTRAIQALKCRVISPPMITFLEETTEIMEVVGLGKLYVTLYVLT